MEEPHTVSGLIRKRAELAGKLEATQDALRQLIIDLDNLDATIRIFAPDVDLAEIKPKPLPPRSAAYKGEIGRVILAALRQAPDGLTGQELAARVMAERGMNTADKKTLRLISKRVGAALRHYRGKGAIRSEGARNGLLVWRPNMPRTVE
jgi:hypothetical protein